MGSTDGTPLLRFYTVSLLRMPSSGARGKSAGELAGVSGPVFAPSGYRQSRHKDVLLAVVKEANRPSRN